MGNRNKDDKPNNKKIIKLTKIVGKTNMKYTLQIHRIHLFSDKMENDFEQFFALNFYVIFSFQCTLKHSNN